MAGALGSPGQSGLDRQRAAIDRQRHALEPAAAAVERQAASARRQQEQASRAPAGGAWDLTPQSWASSLEASEPNCPNLDPKVASAKFQATESQTELPPGLLAAVALQESGLSPCAVSRSGALGLMQLMPATAQELGVEDPLDPWQNLRGGSQFLRQLLDRYGGDVSLALGAYNAGASVVDYYGGVPPYLETQNYVASVLARLRQLPTASESPPKP